MAEQIIRPRNFTDTATDSDLQNADNYLWLDTENKAKKVEITRLAVVGDTAATESDMVAGSKIPIMTAAGPKSLPGNTIAKASEHAALTTYAENVAHSIAPEFDPTRTSENPYKAWKDTVVYAGKTYLFIVNHYGVWNATHVVIFDNLIDKFRKLYNNVGVYDIGTTYNTLDATYSRVMAVYPIQDVNDTFYYRITEKSTNGKLTIRVTSDVSPYSAALLQTVRTLVATDTAAEGNFVIDNEVKASAKYVIILNDTANLEVSFKSKLWVGNSVYSDIDSLDKGSVMPIKTALDFCVDCLKDNSGYELNNSGYMQPTVSQKYCSNMYRCKAGDTLEYKLSSDSVILATYDENKAVVSLVSGTGASNYITGTKTFAANEVYFAISGAIARFGDYEAKYASSFREYEKLKKGLDDVGANFEKVDGILGVIDGGTTYSDLDTALNRVLHFYPIENAKYDYGYKISNISNANNTYIQITNAKAPYDANILQTINIIASGTNEAEGTFTIDPAVRSSAKYIMVGSKSAGAAASFNSKLWLMDDSLAGTSYENKKDIEKINSDLSRLGAEEKLEVNDSYYSNGLYRKCYNPYKDGGSHLYSGQLHCHDRQMNNVTGEPEFINTDDRATTLASHKAAGFDWMTITNYSQLGEVYPTDPGDVPSNFLWMFTSLEVPIKAGTDPEGVQEKIKHVCTFNTNVYTTDRDDGWYNYMTLQAYADLKDAIGCLVELAHPYWVDTYADPEALAKVKGGVRFCEVWDGLTEYHREVHDQGDNVQYPAGKGSDFAWEILLDNGCVCWATAISDVHSGLNNGVIKRGCVKVFSDTLTRESILDGLLKGNFYASSNVDVALESLSFVDGVLTIGTGSASATTTFLKEGGEVLDTVTGATASYTMDGTEKYVRAVVKYPTEGVDYEGNVIYEKIWIQPIINIFSY